MWHKFLKMKQISNEDFSTLIQCAIILKTAVKSRNIEDMYNIIEDGSLISETYEETGDYTECENEEMENLIYKYYKKWIDVIDRTLYNINN